VSHLNALALSRGVDDCATQRIGLLKDRVHFLARRLAGSVMIASQLESLVRRLDSVSVEAMNDVTARLRDLREISPRVAAAMDEYDQKASVDRAEAFLADLAEDRSSAPPEIVPVIDHYISRVRDLIAKAWNRRLSRRELDAHVMQVRLCYSQDLDRILQGLLPRVAG
jgi:hypothetical protein